MAIFYQGMFMTFYPAPPHTFAVLMHHMNVAKNGAE